MIVDVDPDSPDDFLVETELRLKNLVATVPGARWRPKLSKWRIPGTFNALIQLYGIADGNVEFSDEVQAAIAIGKEYEDLLSAARERIKDPQSEHPVLFPFQTETLAATRLCEYASDGGVVLTADPGTGKTVMAIEWLDTSIPALVVAPVATHRGWLRWAEDRFPGRVHLSLPVSPATIVQRRKVLTAFSKAVDDGSAGLLLATYSQLPLHSRQESYGSVRLDEKAKTPKELNKIAWAAVVLDEAHRATNPKAAMARAAWFLAHSAPRRLVMTGTPSKAVPEESLMRLLQLAYIKGWPSWTKMLDIYVDRKYNNWGGAEVVGLRPDTADEFRRLRDLTVVQVPKAVAFPDLVPPLIEQWDVPLSRAQRTQYDELKKEMVTDDANGEQIAVFSPAVRHVRLSEAALATLEASEDGASTVLTAPSPALDALDDIREHACTDLPILVFAASRKLLDLARVKLTNDGHKVAMLVGGMSGPDRDEAIDLYNTRQVDYLLVSLSAAADGWSGTGGNVAVFLLRSYKPEENIQALNRLHGVGRGVPGRRTVIYDVVAPGTVLEDRVLALQAKDARGTETMR